MPPPRRPLVLRDTKSRAVTETPGYSKFPQQGSFDWLSGGRAVAEVAWGYLTRLSKANVDVDTVVYCRYLGQGLVWSSEGRKRFDDAFTALQYVKTFNNNALWFGFGIHHPSEILTDTDTGSVWAALCACLIECYGPEFVPDIFLEMTSILKQASGDPDRGPSLQKWRTVTEVCAGILAQSDFGELAEELMGLDGQDSVAGGVRPAKSGRPVWCRGVSSPRQVAEALIGLSELTRGDYQQITLCGRADACVVAAIAEFLCDMPYEIVANDTKEILKACSDAQQPKLVVLLERGEALGVPEELKYTRKVYLLKNATPFVQTRFGEHNTGCSARVPWTKALSMTFSSAFRNLMKGSAQSFGLAIGSAARLFQAVVEADKAVPEQWLLWCRMYNSRSFGRDFANFAIERFPELRDLSSYIDEASQVKSFEDAAKQYESCMANLANVCACSICKNTNKSPNDTYCLRTLAETIIRTARCLGGMIVDIVPSRSGLEKMYYEQARRAQDYDLRILNPKRKGRGWGNTWGPRRIEARIIEHVYGQFSEPALIALAERIFSGGLLRDHTSDPNNINPAITEKDHVSAVRSNGICYHLLAYRGPAQHAASSSTVCVVPGDINWQGRSYPQISDGIMHSAGAWLDTRHTSKGNEPQTLVGDKILKQMEDCINGNIHLEITESLNATAAPLHAEWGIIKQDIELYRIGISRTATSILRNSGQVMCSRINCQESEHIKDPLHSSLQGTQDQACVAVDIGGIMVYITQEKLPIRFVAAHGTFNPIIQRTECLSCCVLTGMRRGLNKFAVIRPDPLFDMDLESTWQLEYSHLRRLGPDANQGSLKTLTGPSDENSSEEANEASDQDAESVASSETSGEDGISGEEEEDEGKEHVKTSGCLADQVIDGSGEDDGGN